jgi:hypothetical protein
MLQPRRLIVPLPAVSALSAKLWPMRKAFVTDQVLFCSQSLPASGTLHERQS